MFVPVILASAASGSIQYPMPVSPTYVAVAPQASTDMDSALSEWRRLRQSDNYSFGDYARFLASNPGWPGEASLRKSAERSLRPGESPASVIAFFRTDPPTSGNGFARLAEALAVSGRPAEALAAAREAWSASGLTIIDEAGLQARFGPSFTTSDHERRIDRLLSDRKPVDAQRMIVWASPARRGAFMARIAMQTRAIDAETQYAAIAAATSSDAGLLMDRARYLRDGNNEPSARLLLARPHSFTMRPVDPEKWYELQLLMARGAAADRQWQTAYDISRQVDDAFPAGTDISLKPLGVRDDYTSLTWLGGTVALRQLGRPSEAIALFERYSHGGRSLQVASKGLYWAGRAASAAGKLDANSYFERAAAFPELFYGQLALERLGRSVPGPQIAPAVTITPEYRASFTQKRLVRATRQLGLTGRREEQSLFVRALSEAVDSDSDRLLASELASQIGRQDLAVWIARSARNSGSTFYMRSAFPTISGSVPSGRLWSLTHGITRQESSFDRTAISSAGARGMMQLMTGTAREQAGKMGMAYEPSRLTSDPAYNVLLGSAYFQRLLDQWGGNYPLAVASYNAGPGNVRKWINANGDPRLPGADIVRWIEDIPFTETRGYVQRVLENCVVYDRINPSGMHAAPVHLSTYLGKSRPG